MAISGQNNVSCKIFIPRSFNSNSSSFSCFCRIVNWMNTSKVCLKLMLKLIQTVDILWKLVILFQTMMYSSSKWQSRWRMWTSCENFVILFQTMMYSSSKWQSRLRAYRTSLGSTVLPPKPNFQFKFGIFSDTSINHAWGDSAEIILTKIGEDTYVHDLL